MVQTASAESSTARLCALACLSTLDLHPVAVLNVLLVLNVPATKPACRINAKILVQERAGRAPTALSIITVRYAHASLDTPEIHSRVATQYHVSFLLRLFALAAIISSKSVAQYAPNSILLS